MTIHKTGFCLLRILARLAVLLGLSLCWQTSFSQPVLHLGDSRQMSDLRSFVGYFAAEHPYYAPELLGAREEWFTPLRDKPLHWGTNTHWYRITVHNPTNTSSHYLLTCGVANPPYLKAYWLSRDTVTPLDPQRAARYASQANLSIPLRLAPRESGILLIEYRSLANFPLNLQLFHERDYLERNYKFTLMNGISLGAGLVLLLFFAAQFYLQPRPALGFYCLFVLFTLLFMTQIFGYGWRFFWPQMANISAHITSLSGALIYVFYFLFSAHLFDFRQHNPRLYRTLVGWSSATGALALLGMVVNTDLLLSLLVAAGLPFTLYGAVSALRRHQASARYFLLGCSVHTVMTYCLLLACLGFNLGTQVFAVAAAGQFVDILCFSVAILLNHRRVAQVLDWQLQERQRDMETLSFSEQLSAQLRDQSKQAVLQAATSAHDLLQLLAAMRLQLATQNSADPLIARLNSTLVHADTLLRSRLQLNRQDYWQLREDLDGPEFLRELHGRHAPLFAERHLGFEIRVHAGRMVCLRLVVQRVLDNLLSNALRHTHSGRVLLTGRRRHNGYLIQVRDSGDGMAPERLQQIAQPFTTSAPGAEGFGLGLFIVTQLCTSVGYSFSIRSNPGRGTCCSLLIPNEAAPAAPRRVR